MLLNATLVEKPWGRDRLPAPFVAPMDKRIGEIWFAHPAVPLALMIKYLFTSSPLSVQVHPNDTQAQSMGLAHGKDECWYILDAQPGAQLAIGTKNAMNAAELRSAAADGSIEQHLEWHDAIPGHVFEIASGTVHAIGAGISLIEVQQNIDLTYRLYDYGSDRELHLDAAAAVAKAQPFAPELHYLLADQYIVQRPHYAFALGGDHAVVQDLPGQGAYYVLPISGTVKLHQTIAMPGDCLLTDNLPTLELADNTKYLVARAA
jgi:mannose-6-phosphate isomerase